ncbi:MAG: hypothetical protein WB998_05220 [Solirubrobacteraceae bacterium]
MARFLIVGGGVNATALADVLEREGHVVSAGAHNDRRALEHVAIVCWLEGRSPERFLLASVDSSMRGFVYQPHDWERSVLETAERNSIPTAALRSDPSDLAVWLAEASEAVASLIEGPGESAPARYAGR